MSCVDRRRRRLTTLMSISYSRPTTPCCDVLPTVWCLNTAFVARLAACLRGLTLNVTLKDNNVAVWSAGTGKRAPPLIAGSGSTQLVLRFCCTAAKKKNTGGIVWRCVGAHQQRFGARCRRHLDDIGKLPALLTTPLTALRLFSCVKLKPPVPTQLVYLRHQFWLRQHRCWRRYGRARRLRYGESS